MKLTARNLFYALSDENKEMATAHGKVGTELSWQMGSFVFLGKGHLCQVLNFTYHWCALALISVHLCQSQYSDCMCLVVFLHFILLR